MLIMYYWPTLTCFKSFGVVSQVYGANEYNTRVDVLWATGNHKKGYQLTMFQSIKDERPEKRRIFAGIFVVVDDE